MEKQVLSPKAKRMQQFIICDKVLELEYDGQREVCGYMKKLCGETPKYFFQSQSFQMRFCVLDLSLMTFKYAKSPKDSWTEMKMDEITFAGPKDPEPGKQLKVKSLYDLKYLIYLQCAKRKFVFSCNSRSDLMMWQSALDAFFKIKEAFLLYSSQSKRKKKLQLEKSDSLVLHRKSIDRQGEQSHPKPDQKRAQTPQTKKTIQLDDQSVAQQPQRSSTPQQRNEPEELVKQYKAKLTARYQKSGNNFIQNPQAVPDQVDKIETFVEQYDGVPYYSNTVQRDPDDEIPYPVSETAHQLESTGLQQRIQLLRLRSQQIKENLGVQFKSPVMLPSELPQQKSEEMPQQTVFRRRHFTSKQAPQKREIEVKASFIERLEQNQ